jgi:hypothetical protein
MFFNTTNETGEELKESWRKVGDQEELIEEFFRVNSDKIFTPDEIQSTIPGFVGTPITSIRRAMTNLTASGVLRKTNIKRLGRYGKKNYCWAYNVGPVQSNLL